MGFWPLDPPMFSTPVEATEGEAQEDDDGTHGYWPITCLKCGYVRIFHVETLLGQ